MVLIVLIVLWSIVLVPPAWQSHVEARRARQVDAFRRKLAGLVATVASLAGAFALSDVRAWALHGLVVTAFVAYLAALRRLKRLAMERRAKVRYFPAQAPAPASSASGASSASSAAVR